MSTAVDSLPGIYEARRRDGLVMRGRLVVRADELAPIIAQRLDEYAASQPYFLPADPAAARQGDAFDPVAFTFAVYEEDEVVASVRWQGEIARELELDALLTAAELATVPPGPLLQGGRLQIRPDHRNQGISELTLYVSLLWCAAHTRYRGYYGVGRPRTAQHYQQLGALPLTSRPVTVPGRTGAYMALHGDLAGTAGVIAGRLRAQGWTLRPDPDEVLAAGPPRLVVEPVGPYLHRIGDAPAAVLAQRRERVLFLLDPAAFSAELVLRVYALTGGGSLDRVILGRLPADMGRGAVAEAFPGASVDALSEGRQDRPPRPLGMGLAIRPSPSPAGDLCLLSDEITGLQWELEP